MPQKASTIELTGPELWLAGQTGLARFIEATIAGRQPINGQDPYHSAADHLFGALAEAALAKALRVYWLGEWLNHRAPDVAGHQVRHSRHENARLLIQPGDDDSARYYLLTGQPPRFTIRGWITGREAKQPHLWSYDLPRPCYAVPQEDLHPWHASTTTPT